jgi:hypothetical protein
MTQTSVLDLERKLLEKQEKLDRKPKVLAELGLP